MSDHYDRYNGMENLHGTNLAEVGTDLISRQAAINEVDSETVSTNPEHFKSSEKFIKFMDDADIASFGKWQLANGFNTALVATKIQLEKLPSAQPEPCEDAVSRLEIIRNLHKYFKEGFEQDKWWNSGHVIHAIMDAPSVTPKQRTGKWIKLDMHRGMADHKCTACEQECYVPTCMGEPMYAFCPNCGAKMEE